MRSRFGKSAFARERVTDAVLNQSKAHTVMKLLARRPHRERAPKIRKRVIELAAVQVKRAQICERYVVVFRHRERVSPKRFTVAPIRRLFPSDTTERDDRGCCARRENFLPNRNRF